MKKYMLISLAIVTGCVTGDVSKQAVKGSRWVVRNCPVERVYADEADRVVRENIYFENGRVPIIGNCWRDTEAVGKWCKTQGVSCHQAYKGNHSWLVVGGEVVEYVDGVDLIRRRQL